MPSGGARTRSGPPPDPNALRRRRKDDAEWRSLPADGRVGDPPTWPLSRPTARELTVWRRQWTRPQAVVWEERHQEEEVALYVRALVAAEKSKASTASRSLVLRMMDSLMLTEAGLRSARCRIEAANPATPTTQDTTGRSARTRLTLVAGGAA